MKSFLFWFFQALSLPLSRWCIRLNSKGWSQGPNSCAYIGILPSRMHLSAITTHYWLLQYFIGHYHPLTTIQKWLSKLMSVTKFQKCYDHELTKWLNLCVSDIIAKKLTRGRKDIYLDNQKASINRTLWRGKSQELIMKIKLKYKNTSI